MQKPVKKPKNPCFSSGPCAKRPGWSLEALERTAAGRSHRAGVSKAMLKDLIERHRKLLGIPADYRIGIVAASDIGAVEMAMWSLLGPRPVDVFAWESFSRDWLVDVTQELKVKGSIGHEAPFGVLPDLSKARKEADIVFAWNQFVILVGMGCQFVQRFRVDNRGVHISQKEFFTPSVGGGDEKVDFCFSQKIH